MSNLKNFEKEKNIENEYLKIMNQSITSTNFDTNNSIKNKKKLRIRSNTIFAYQDDHIYTNLYADDFEENCYNDTSFIPFNNNLNNSNFFSTVCDKSQWIKLNNDIFSENKNHDDLDNSICSVEDDMERQLGFLNDVEDDLNDAKLSLYEDSSIFSEKSYNNNKNNHNITTPIHTNYLQTLDTDDTKILNTQSCSSMITNINYATTSNGSSFLDDKKLLLLKDQNILNSNNTNTNLNNNNNNPMVNQNNLNGSEKSYLSNQNINLSHAKSVDLNSNQSPYRLSNLGFNQNFIPQKFITNTNIHSFGHFNPFELERNFQNQYGTYSFCYDSNYFYKNSIPLFDYKCPQAPQQFKMNYNDEKNIIDNLLILIKDQNGCRIIQNKLEDKNPEFMMKFFEKILNNLTDVICDQFGNYVIQKYIEICDEKILISKLLEKNKANLYNIAINCYGTRGLQKMLEVTKTENDYTIIKEFITNNIFSLIKDINGNHVIQKILMIYPQNKNSYILDEINQSIIEISKLKQGGCIFQKINEKANEQDKNNLIWKILKNIEKLINDEHGNFIIQQILKLKSDQFTKYIFDYTCENLNQLSKQKYSSNVVDKCILFEDDKYRESIVDKMISAKLIPELISDQFGNYVVQKALQITTGLKFMEIIDMIKKVTKTLKYTNYGKKIYENLMNNYGEYLSNHNNYKNLAKLPKKNLKKGLNKSINNINNNIDNNSISININNDNLNPEIICEDSNQNLKKNENILNNFNKLQTKNNSNEYTNCNPAGKTNNKIINNQNEMLTSHSEISIDKKSENSKNYENRNSDTSKINCKNFESNENLFVDLDKSFSQARPRNGSIV